MKKSEMKSNEWRSIQKVNQLRRGDIIRHIIGKDSYVVNSIFGERATALNSKDITNANEWLVLDCR